MRRIGSTQARSDDRCPVLTPRLSCCGCLGPEQIDIGLIYLDQVLTTPCNHAVNDVLFLAASHLTNFTGHVDSIFVLHMLLLMMVVACH